MDGIRPVDVDLDYESLGKSLSAQHLFLVEIVGRICRDIGQKTFNL